MAEHHLAREDDGAGVDLVQVGVLGSRTVRGLKDGVARLVVDIATGGNADASDLA
jgi:hypothetical protein